MPSPPHIVHVVADDLGWSDLGFAATTAPRTPNIDALAMGGVRLERFYAAKECAPSRTAIMTGRLPFQYGYYQNPSDEGGVPLNYTFLPETLHAAGYATHAIGNGTPVSAPRRTRRRGGDSTRFSDSTTGARNT